MANDMIHYFVSRVTRPRPVQAKSYYSPSNYREVGKTLTASDTSRFFVHLPHEIIAAVVDYCYPLLPQPTAKSSTERYTSDVRGGTRSCVLVTFILLVAGTATAAAEVVKFTSNLSDAIEIGQSALYHCSVNDTRVSINWLINGSNAISSDINVTGAATSSSILTIPGLVQYNNTEVRCAAFGHLDNNVLYNNFSDSILKIQGILGAVTNLSCEQNNLCIECMWDGPFTLTQPIQYVINFTSNERYITTLTTMDTAISHCLCGQYNISVAASNTVGLGDVTYKAVTTLIPNYLLPKDFSNTTNKEGEWNITFAANTSCLAGNYEVIAYEEEEDIAIGTAIAEKEILKGTIQAGQLPKRKWNLSIRVQNNISFIQTSEPIAFSTYGIRKTSVKAKISELCFSVEFVEESDTEECLVVYKCNRESANGNVTLQRNETSKCQKNIDANTYTVTFHDGNDVTFDKLENIMVSSPPSSSPPSSTILPTSTKIEMTLTSSSLSPSVTTNGGSSIHLILAAVLFFLLCIICIVAIAILTITTCLMHKKKYRGKVKADEVNTEAAIQTQSFSKKQPHAINYCETEVSTDRPRAPPPMEEATQYTQIKHDAQNTIGLYCLATPSVSIEPDNPQLDDNSEYSHLNTRGYRSPHQPDFTCNDAKNNETYSTIAPTASQHNCSFTVNTELTHGTLTKYVVSHISDKWYEMGLALALTPDDLEELRGSNQELSDVFMMWEDNKTRPFTWYTLITTLRSINEHDLAEQLLNMKQ